LAKRFRQIQLMALADEKPDFSVIIDDFRHGIWFEPGTAANVDRLEELFRERFLERLIVFCQATCACKLYSAMTVGRNQDLATQPREPSLCVHIASDQIVIQLKDRQMNLDVPHTSDRLHQQRSNIEPGVIKKADDATIFCSHVVSSPMIRDA